MPVTRNSGNRVAQEISEVTMIVAMKNPATRYLHGLLPFHVGGGCVEKIAEMMPEAMVARRRR
jgi:hypothetical protein